MADVIPFRPKPGRQRITYQNPYELLLRMSLDTITLAGRYPTLPLLRDVLRSAPRNTGDLADDNWAAESVCWNLLNSMEHRAGAGEVDNGEFHRILHFWTKSFVGQHVPLRPAVLSMLDMLAEVEPPAPPPLPAPTGKVPPWAHYFGHPAFPPPQGKV